MVFTKFLDNFTGKPAICDLPRPKCMAVSVSPWCTTFCVESYVVNMRYTACGIYDSMQLIVTVMLQESNRNIFHVYFLSMTWRPQQKRPIMACYLKYFKVWRNIVSNYYYNLSNKGESEVNTWRLKISIKNYLASPKKTKSFSKKILPLFKIQQITGTFGKVEKCCEGQKMRLLV